MDLKKIQTQLKYRVEPSPDGGFIARPDDPSVPVIEGRTREEVQQKIRTQAFHNLAAEFPMLKGVLDDQLEKTSDGKTSTTFIVRTNSGEKQVITSATPDQVRQFAKGMGALLGKNFADLAESIVLQGTVNKRTLTTEEKTILNANPGNPDRGIVGNAPIVPENANRWPWIALGLLVIAAVMYALLYHR